MTTPPKDDSPWSEATPVVDAQAVSIEKDKEIEEGLDGKEKLAEAADEVKQTAQPVAYDEEEFDLDRRHRRRRGDRMVGAMVSWAIGAEQAD